MPVSAFILAGEASGDRLAAQLMVAAKEVFPGISWFGIGGAKMQKAGLFPLGDMDSLSIIGFGEALASFRTLSKLADRLIADILARRPEYVFTIDSKGFSLRFAKRLRTALAGKAYQPKLIHMVAPTVWAWGAWRAKKFGQYFDHIFCLFPFEPAYFSDLPVEAVFVGHPDSDGQCRPFPDKKGGEHILLLPGSRAAEIARHLPVMLEAAFQLIQKNPSIRFSLPLLPHLHDQAAEILEKSETGQVIVLNALPASQAFKEAHFMIACSGTVTLEAAIAGVPGLVIYHLSLANRIFAKWFYKPATPVLPDIILDSHFYPFLLPPHLRAENITALTEQGLGDIENRNKEGKKMSEQLKSVLSPDGKKFAERLKIALQTLS